MKPSEKKARSLLHEMRFQDWYGWHVKSVRGWACVDETEIANLKNISETRSEAEFRKLLWSKSLLGKEHQYSVIPVRITIEQKQVPKNRRRG